MLRNLIVFSLNEFGLRAGSRKPIASNHPRSIDASNEQKLNRQEIWKNSKVCHSEPRSGEESAVCRQRHMPYLFPAICSRSRSSFARASGVKFSPKSVNSYIGRISTSDSPGIGFGQRFNHSTASSMDRTCQIQ